MIQLDRIKSIQEGEFVIYASSSGNYKFYSGRVVKQPDGLSEPKYLRLVPTDKRLKPTQLAIGNLNIGKPRHFIRELPFNSGVAFRISKEDLMSGKDLSQDLRAQTQRTDLYTDIALDYLLEQLDEIRANFEYDSN